MSAALQDELIEGGFSRRVAQVTVSLEPGLVLQRDSGRFDQPEPQPTRQEALSVFLKAALTAGVRIDDCPATYACIRKAL